MCLVIMGKKYSNFKKLLSQKEEDLADRNEELEAQHEELSAAVEALIEKNNYLERTLAELNTRNKEIDQIVYRTSHDLKSPITSLEGLFNLIEKEPKEDLLPYLSMARKSTGNMKSLLGMLVRYSNNIVSEQQEKEIDFTRLWSEAIDQLHEVNGFEDVKIVVRKSIDHKFYGDELRIRSTLYNLLKNAIDFRKKDFAQVEVKFTTENDRLRVAVSDNGMGIPIEIQSKVFDMFYRGTNVSKGSGLGLYLSKRNIELMGGSINLVSTEGIGTTVSFTISNRCKKKRKA